MAGRAGSWPVRQIPVLIALLVAAAGLSGCTRGGDRDRVQASISVSPQAALVDQPVAVTVRDLPAGARTILTARAKDTAGITWSATAQFTATSAGEVSLGQPPVGGSYTGVNPMGLFTLMAPPPGSAPDWFLYGDAGYEVTVEAAVDGRVVATTTARRQDPLAAGVARSSCCAPSPEWIPATCLWPGCRGAARPRCCSAPTSPSWSTASSPGCPARW